MDCEKCNPDLTRFLEKSIKGVKTVLEKTSLLDYDQIVWIHNVLQKEAAGNPAEAHLLEEKISMTFIRNVTQNQYKISDILRIGGKVLAIHNISYQREY